MQRFEQANRVLNEKNSCLHIFTSLLPDLAFVIDEHGRYLEILNPTSYQLYKEAEQVKGQLLHEVFHKADADRFLAVIRTALETGEQQNFEYQLDALGDERWFKARVDPLPMQPGDTARVAWQSREITECKQTEQALKRSQYYFENLDRISRVLSQAADVDEMLHRVVHEILDIFQVDRAWFLYPCDPDAPTWRVPVEATVPEYPGAFVQNADMPTDETSGEVFRRALETGGPLVFQVASGDETATTSNSGPVDFEVIEFDRVAEVLELFNIKSQIVVAIHPKAGKPWLLGVHQCACHRRWNNDEVRLFEEIASRISDCLTNFVLMRRLEDDIAERKRIEASLIESEGRIQAILDNTSAVVYVKDLEGRYLLINRRYEMLFHQDRDAIKGKCDHDIFPRDKAAAFRANDLEVIRQRAPMEFDEVVPHEDGLHTYISVKFPLFDNNDGLYAVCGISTDITERKRIEEETRGLLKRNRALTQRLFEIQEEERRYLSQELHDEFGQLLAAMNFHAQAVKTKAMALSPELSASAEALSEISQGLLDGIRGMIRQLRPIMLDELGLVVSLQELVNQNQRRYPNLQFTLSTDGELADLGDFLNITLYRITQEAITNAVKHAEAENLAIHLSHCSAENEADADRVLLSIEDDGKGLDLSTIDIGMGLSGVRERVLVAGGEFTLAPGRNGGLCIKVSLPVFLDQQ